MVWFERALMSFYRPSIVTFSLPLRVSDIVAFGEQKRQYLKRVKVEKKLLWRAYRNSSTLFRAISLRDFQPMWSWSTNRQFSPPHSRANWKSVALIVRAISLRDFQPMWSWSTNPPTSQTDRQTDRRTDDMQSQCRALHYSALCIAR